MIGDLFSSLRDQAAGAGDPPRRLPRPTREMLSDRRFSSRVSDLVTIAQRNTIPAEALPIVRRRLADRDGIDITEQEIAAVNHRHWAWVGRRPIPSFPEAMTAVAKWLPAEFLRARTDKSERRQS